MQILKLGQASGLHFKDYAQRLPVNQNRPWDCLMNPIVLGVDICKRETKHKETVIRKRRGYPVRMAESVGSAS
ncbi:hypothetical protein M758_UG284200 [Ceratodon purpureus]|nr:hypothetical protein M758_UG284200 [Ceratodon purpureus]